MCLSWRRCTFIGLQPARRSFFNMSSVMLPWTLGRDFDTRAAQFIKYYFRCDRPLAQLFWRLLFFPYTSRVSIISNSLYFFNGLWTVETETKRCLDMALLPLLISSFSVLRSPLCSFSFAMLTKMMLEEECQHFQRTTLVYQIFEHSRTIKNNQKHRGV